MAPVTSEELSRSVAGQTVATRFRDTVAARGPLTALRWQVEDGWREWTWAELADRARRVAGALAHLGVRPRDRVVLMMRNRPEFYVADLACMLVGATPVSIYNSSSPEQVQYLAHHCGAVAGIVEDADYLERILKVREELPDLAHVAVVDDDGRAPDDVLRLAELLASAPVDLDEAAATVTPEDLATIIYTSGTTGPPKGVMIDHANVVWTVESLHRSLPIDPTGFRVVSYLPMAHIAERMVSYYWGLTFGYEVTTCPEPSQLARHLV